MNKDDVILFLFALLDDIDTAGDIAKGDDKMYRALAEKAQQRRWETGITSDGYTLTMPATAERYPHEFTGNAEPYCVHCNTLDQYDHGECPARLRWLLDRARSTPAPAEGMVKVRRDLVVVFDGPPAHESGRFVECETTDGRSIRAGKWHERDDGLWALVVPAALPAYTPPQPITVIGEVAE